jgi:hypothetical protein
MPDETTYIDLDQIGSGIKVSDAIRLQPTR